MSCINGNSKYHVTQTVFTCKQDQSNDLWSFMVVSNKTAVTNYLWSTSWWELVVGAGVHRLFVQCPQASVNLIIVSCFLVTTKCVAGHLVPRLSWASLGTRLPNCWVLYSLPSWTLDCVNLAPSLVPRPLPPEEKPGTHCLHMYKIFSITCLPSLPVLVPRLSDMTFKIFNRAYTQHTLVLSSPSYTHIWFGTKSGIKLTYRNLCYTLHMLVYLVL